MGLYGKGCKSFVSSLALKKYFGEHTGNFSLNLDWPEMVVGNGLNVKRTPCTYVQLILYFSSGLMQIFIAIVIFNFSTEVSDGWVRVLEYRQAHHSNP